LHWRQPQNLSSPAAQPWSSSQSLRAYGVNIWIFDRRSASRRFESSMMATGDHFRYRRVQSRRGLLLSTSWASRETISDLITTLIIASLCLSCNWQRSGPDVYDRPPDLGLLLFDLWGCVRSWLVFCCVHFSISREE
jgi:hypothetical protein